jgi:hypothetical protein
MTAKPAAAKRRARHLRADEDGEIHVEMKEGVKEKNKRERCVFEMQCRHLVALLRI